MGAQLCDHEDRVCGWMKLHDNVEVLNLLNLGIRVRCFVVEREKGWRWNGGHLCYRGTIDWTIHPDDLPRVEKLRERYDSGSETE